MATAPSRYGTRWTTYLHTITDLEASSKRFALISPPKLPQTLLIDGLDGAGPLVVGTHFSLIDSELHWSGKELDGVLGSNDRLRITFI